MKDVKSKHTLDRPGTYEIKVVGHLDKSWSDWFEGIVFTTESSSGSPGITTLTGIIADQAALQGLLSRLYSLGLPLISVNLVRDSENTNDLGSKRGDRQT